MLAGRFGGIVIAGMCALMAATLYARPFSVVVYNVENLFDADGVANYDDYRAEIYSPAHLRTKLENICRVLAAIDDGRGPDIVLLQEIELDQTPRRNTKAAQNGDPFGGKSWSHWLQQKTLPAALADLPAEAWLLHALEERGLRGYTVVVGDEGPGLHEDGNPHSVKCVTLTRFPVRAVRRFPLLNARHLLEVEVDVAGAPLHVFNLHWKSGASDAALEGVRVQNARVLRQRLDAILRDDPHGDVIIGGDFNSQYNQSQRYPAMKVTGINDVLGSQGDELAVRGTRRDLYNLWFELPAEQRGSDTYRGEWGTLIQLLISRGLYDQRGVQYDDNSFSVLRLPGLNVDAAGVPIRWDGGGSAGSGFSDHLPLVARFRRVAKDQPTGWVTLENPSRTESDAAVRRVEFPRADLTQAIATARLPRDVHLRDGSWNGKLFLVTGPAVPDRHPRVIVKDEEYEIYAVNDAVRTAIREQADRGAMRFYGELGTYKGRWQFVVREPEWVLSAR